MKPSRRLTLAALAFALGGPAVAQQAVQEWSPEVVRKAEQALKDRRFVAGPVDGRMDPMTHFGVRRFQASQNLAVTGGLNQETLAALGIEASEYPASAQRQPRIAEPRFSREVIRQAEQALHEMNLIAGPVDGIMDPQTRFGLSRFQTSQDLASTGNLNMETLQMLGIEAGGRNASAGAGARGSQSYQVASNLYTPRNIRAVEQALKDMNYAVGPVNTVIEPDTHYGLRQFQQQHGLAPTGNLNYETLERMGIDVAQAAR